MPDSATTPSTEGSVATARKPKRHFDLAETDAAAAASARDDAPSAIRATTKPVAVAPEAAPLTPAVVARKPVAMIPLVAASAPSDKASDSTSDSTEASGEDKAEGGCCGGGCCS
ncbi:hypothetical protein [Marisediminicola antarctica]|uniref:Uncharacterized protein n=1 Tax=Marisediminicola antarctica TaxID=674079 RepID=A0A7L5AFW2_9MICO|nr:hypothetical protein [Marisediminicola antarctica]QHO68856.1 hypothetical protein BHD05_03580 [Marisediminicola antarctica]